MEGMGAAHRGYRRHRHHRLDPVPGPGDRPDHQERAGRQYHIALIEQLGVVRSWNVLDTEFADIAARGSEDFESLRDVERWRFSDFASRHFDVWEFGYSMGQRGLIATDIMDAFNDGYCRSMPGPGMRSVWESGIATNSADFSDVVENCFAASGWPMGQPE
jgi:hypothetical protein